MKKVRADSLVVYQGNNVIVVARRAIDAETAAAKINDMLEKAFWAGLRYKDPHRVLYEAPSVFDDDNDEDEAPLIDVPDGSDNPDYGPEKIPPRPVHKLTVDELPKHKPDI